MVNYIAKTLHDNNKGKETTDSDFGIVNGDLSIRLDNLDTDIPNGEYLVTETVRYERIFDMSPSDDIESGHDIENTVKRQKLRPGDRVVVLWIANIPVVIGRFEQPGDEGKMD